MDAQQRQARHHRHSPSEIGSQHSEDETEHHVNAANLFNKSGPSSPKDDPRHTDARLRAIERAKQAYKDEQAARKEKLRWLEEENALLELKKKALQEEEDRLYAQQLQSQFNGRGTNSGTNSSPSTPSQSPPPRLSRQPSQRVHHSSQQGGRYVNLDTMDFMAIQQEPSFQAYVEKYVEQNKDQFLESLINKGAKVPFDFDVDRKVKKQEPSTHEVIKQLQRDMDNMKAPKSTFNLDSICPNPIDKSVVMIDFPKKVEFPTYDKYDGIGDPHDHVRQFYIMSFSFHHEDSYLMRLFPRSLKGQAMEWFTNLTPPVKTFKELVERFVQHFAYNLT